MRSCDEVIDLISAALDGALTPDEQTALNEHLASCPACSALFADLSALHIASAELEDVPAPAGFAARVMEAISADSTQEQPDNVIPFPAKKPPRTPWKKLAASAAVVAIIALGAVSLPGQFGGNTTADTAAPADAGFAVAESAAEPGDAPAEAMMDVAMASTATYDQKEQNTGSAQKFSLESAAEDSAPSEPAAEEQDSLSAHTTAAAELLTVCGVLVLTGEDLPEGLEEFSCIRSTDGTLTYTVSADYFFSCPQATAEDLLNFDVAIDPNAEYGLIVVQPN